jgi:hypothetical protein
VKTSLGCSDLELALTNVLKEFRRPNDQIDERTDEWEKSASSGAANKESIADSTLGIRISPVNEREPDDYDNDDKEVREDIHLGSLSPCLTGSSSIRSGSVAASLNRSSELQLDVQG